MAIDITQPQ